jgi:hypothetical protein
MKLFSRKNVFDIEGCRLFSFDTASELANGGFDGVFQRIQNNNNTNGIQENFVKNNELTKKEIKILKLFSKEICDFVLKKYLNFILDTGDARIVLEEPNEIFYLKKIGLQMGFLPESSLFIKFLNDEAKKHYATFDINNDYRKLYIYFSKFEISDNQLVITLVGEITDKK